MSDILRFVASHGTVSVVLPALNEQDNIEKSVLDCLEACEEHFSDVEVIVVDDGSTDHTSEVVRGIMEKDPRVRLERHEHNRGYGAALRTGFAASRNEWVFFTDSDGQFDPREMSKMVHFLNDYDIVAGWRKKRQDNLYRRFLGWCLSRSVYYLFGTGMKDIDCAFKFLRGDKLRSLPLYSEGPLINTEILYHARKQNWRVVQMGVTHFPRKAGTQTGGDLGVVLRAGYHYWLLFYRLHTGNFDGGV